MLEKREKEKIFRNEILTRDYLNILNPVDVDVRKFIFL